jgi:hypothetical protein
MADLNALIAQGVQFQAPPNPFAQYAQMQQLQQGEQANQLNQMKMEEMRADAEQRNALRRLNPSDPGYEAQLSKLNPSLGIAYRKDRNAASSAETKLIADKLALLPDAYRMADTPEAYYKLHESVHSDPVLGPWLNSVGATKEQGLAKLNDAVSKGEFGKLRMASMQSVNQILEGMKPLVVGASASAYDPTTGTFKQAPAAPEKAAPPTTLAKLISERDALPANDPQRSVYNAMIAKETTHTPGTTVNVSTEKKYGEAFGTKVADRDVALLDTASKAPELAANADRVLSILKQGNVFTGSAADIKLNLARVLNIAGANNNEKIANTEMLMSGLARNTLGAVKSSGLGSGQGFTDKDLQFLQDAEGGRITLNAQSIQRLAELSRMAAEKSADTWNTRVKQIPASAIQGTGLSTDPISVPKRAAAPKSAPVAGAVQDGYKFKGGDPAVQSNWEKI